MTNVSLPQGISVSDAHDYRCLQLVATVFSAFRKYWGYSTEKTLDIFKQNEIYEFIKNNYDFYHTVGTVYIVEDVRECLNLPTGNWVKQ